VVKDDKEVLINKMMGVAFTDHADAYHNKCTMQW
jgi:hypothetical protein